MNQNDNFITELGQKAVSLEWFLSRHSNIVSEEELKKSEAPNGEKPNENVLIHPIAMLSPDSQS